jgi:CBS domain-containing protein
MVSLGISHIPITSGSDVVGTLSLRDVLKAIHDGNITGKLSDIASKSLVYEDVDASVEDIADLIVSKYVGAEPLFKGEPKAANLRGIITEWDLVRLYATMVRAHVLSEAEPSKIKGLVIQH